MNNELPGYEVEEISLEEAVRILSSDEYTETDTITGLDILAYALPGLNQGYGLRQVG